MCANYDVPYSGYDGGWDKMGKCLQDSPEMSTTCALIPLQPATTLHKLVLAQTPPESEWRQRHGESESKKDVSSTKVEEDKATVAVGSKGAMNLKAAKEAVVFMGFPDTLVQLVIDMEHLDPSLRFTSAQELYERVEALANHPKRQADLFLKFHQHQQASSASSTNVAEPGRGRQAPGVLSSNANSDRQTPPAGMPEGTCQSATAAVSSSSPQTPFSSVAASTSGRVASEMAQSPEASSEEASETTSARDLEEAMAQNSHRGAASGAAKTSSAEQLRSRVRRLAEENRRLTQRKLCRACKAVELSSSGVTFLPCGHFITCEACSEKFDNCPACGRVIMGTVRTFLS